MFGIWIQLSYLGIANVLFISVSASVFTRPGCQKADNSPLEMAQELRLPRPPP
jgi:hypothetical protein